MKKAAALIILSLLIYSCFPEPKYEPAKIIAIGGFFTDSRDGKVYKTTQIGDQKWMAENLNYAAESSKCYGDGKMCVYSDAPRQCNFLVITPGDDAHANCERYGRLYNYKTAKTACPEGWHLPDEEEWETLAELSGTIYIAGKTLKAKSGWMPTPWEGEIYYGYNGYEPYSSNGTDDFGFAALPGGHGTADSIFADSGRYTTWWTATELNADSAFRRYISFRSGAFWNASIKSDLYSVRCVQGEAIKHEIVRGTFTDKRDGQEYKTVAIGKQTWMAQNLNYIATVEKDKKEYKTKFVGMANERRMIWEIIDKNSICYEPEVCIDGKKPGKCKRDLEEEKKIGLANCEKFGRLYTWGLAQSVCPEGWHLPSVKEFNALIDYAGGWEAAGKKLKTYADWTMGWGEEKGGIDTYGFAALPGGRRSSPADKFDDRSNRPWFKFGTYGAWWSTSDYYYMRMGTFFIGAEVTNKPNDHYYSVRCLRDEQ